MKYRLLVKPNSREDSVVYDTENEVYLVSVKARPIDGDANKAVIKIMANYLDVPKSLLELEKGSKSKYKTLILNK